MIKSIKGNHFNRGVSIMGVCYKKLWKLLIDEDIKVTDLRIKTGIAASTFSKMKKNEYVSLEVLVRVCLALNCELSDIVQIERNTEV